MNPKTLLFIIFTLFSVISFSSGTTYFNDSSEVKWYTMPIEHAPVENDEIELNTFQSKNKNDSSIKPDYLPWIDIRNAFRYSNEEAPIAKLVKYFEPENESYYKETLNFAILFIVFAAVVGVGLIIYLVMRCSGGCMGPKNKKRAERDDCFKWTLVIIGALISFLCFILIFFFSKRHYDALDYLDESKAMLTDIKSDLESRLLNLTIHNVKSTRGKHISTTIPDIDVIFQDIEDSKKRYDQLVTDVKDYESPKYISQTTILIIDMILALVGILGYYLHKSKITWVAQFLLFVSIIFLLIIVGFEASYMVVGIDFCQGLRQTMLSSYYPDKDQGIGKYISCPANDAKRALSIAMFQMKETFNILYDETKEFVGNRIVFNETFEDTFSYSTRNNTHYKFLHYVIPRNWSNFTEDGEEVLPDEEGKKYAMNNMVNLIDYNHILGDLKSLVSCQSADNAINRLEEFYCVNNFDNVQNEIIFYLVGIVGLLILAVGLNKIILIIDRDAAKSLRGNKKYQRDDLDDDDEDEDDRKRKIN